MSDELSKLIETVSIGGPSNWKAALVREYIQSRELLTKEEQSHLRVLCRFLSTHSDSSERVDAVEMLGQIGTRSDVFSLKLSCRDVEPMVRCAAVSSLATVYGKRAFKFLRGLVSEHDPVVRRWTYVAIFDTGHLEAVDWLRSRLDFEHDDVAKVGILSALSEAGIAGIKKELTGLLESDNRYVRKLASEAIANETANN
ncbi:MAG: HEAT repeat domain-containing protein [Fimbriimonadaceae bacterium]|nr:HEAT repeat domain-containing protein [Fimbriimonadaceae bacterium]